MSEDTVVLLLMDVVSTDLGGDDDDECKESICVCVCVLFIKLKNFIKSRIFWL